MLSTEHKLDSVLSIKVLEFRMTGIEFGITNIHLISNVKPRNKS